MSLESDAKAEKKPVSVVYYSKKHLLLKVDNPTAQAIYESGFFGQWSSDDHLELAPEEILLLMDRGRIEVIDLDSKEPLTQSNLVTHFFTHYTKDFWSRYLVYKDLRNRGYVVRIGTRITAPYRIYGRGKTPGKSASKVTVFPLSEGQELELDFLDQIVTQAKIDRKKLLLSVIDRLGDVTYYNASQLELELNELEYEYRDELPAETSEKGE